MVVLRSIQVICGWEAVEVGVVGVEDLGGVDAVVVGRVGAAVEPPLRPVHQQVRREVSVRRLRHRHVRVVDLPLVPRQHLEDVGHDVGGSLQVADLEGREIAHLDDG